MVCPHPLDVIQYARSSYYYDNVFYHSNDFDMHRTTRPDFSTLFQKKSYQSSSLFVNLKTI